jgi:hypothetical protein
VSDSVFNQCRPRGRSKWLGSVVAILAVAVTLLAPITAHASTLVTTVVGGLNGWVQDGSNGASITGSVSAAPDTPTVGRFSVAAPSCPSGATCGNVYPSGGCTSPLGLHSGGLVVPGLLSPGGGGFTVTCGIGDTVDAGAFGAADFNYSAGSTALGTRLGAPFEYNGQWAVTSGGQAPSTGQLTVTVGDDGVAHAVYVATGSACVATPCYLQAEPDWTFPSNLTFPRIGPLSGTDI